MTEYPLIDLLDQEIHALDDWRAKRKLARSRIARRKILHVLNTLACCVWAITVFMWYSDLQMLTLIPMVILWFCLGIDLAKYDIPELEKAEEKAQAVYETRVQCTLGAASGY